MLGIQHKQRRQLGLIRLFFLDVDFKQLQSAGITQRPNPCGNAEADETCPPEVQKDSSLLREQWRCIQTARNTGKDLGPPLSVLPT